MRRMSPDYSGNAYEHSRGLAYDYNYDPYNCDSPGKAGKLDPYSDDYSIPPKSSPHRTRSPDAYSNAGTSQISSFKKGSGWSRRRANACHFRIPHSGLPRTIQQTHLVNTRFIDPYSDDYCIPSKSLPHSPRSPTFSRRPDRSVRRPTPPPIPASPTLEYL